MKKEKKKLDELTQAKLIYTIELGVFATIFLTLGLLFYFGVIPMSERRINVFTWVTLVGGFLTFGDFIWLLSSKKRQKKNSMLDKIMLLPIPLCLIPIDIMTLAKGRFADSVYSMVLGITFMYIAVIYVVQLVYHWYHPVPMLIEGGENIKKAEEQDALEANKSELDESKVVEVDSVAKPTEEKKADDNEKQ